MCQQKALVTALEGATRGHTFDLQIRYQIASCQVGLAQGDLARTLGTMKRQGNAGLAEEVAAGMQTGGNMHYLTAGKAA